MCIDIHEITCMILLVELLWNNTYAIPSTVIATLFGKWDIVFATTHRRNYFLGICTNGSRGESLSSRLFSHLSCLSAPLLASSPLFLRDQDFVLCLLVTISLCAWPLRDSLLLALVASTIFALPSRTLSSVLTSRRPSLPQIFRPSPLLDSFYFVFLRGEVCASLCYQYFRSGSPRASSRFFPSVTRISCFAFWWPSLSAPGVSAILCC